MAPADRIRDHAPQAVAAENDDEALRIILQLREALHELRLMVATEYHCHKDVAAD